MQDGANQEIEEGKFVIFSEHKTGQLSLGCIIGRTAKTVKVARPHYSWQSKTINKTSERLVQVSDAVAESMDKGFFDNIKSGGEIEPR